MTIEPSIDSKSDHKEPLSPISGNSGSVGYNSSNPSKRFESAFESMLKISLSSQGKQLEKRVINEQS